MRDAPAEPIDAARAREDRISRQSVDEAVTRLTLRATPDEAWRALVFFEDVPQRPGLLLRALLPVPLRTSKPALAVGATVACTYSGGRTIAKRITVVEAPSLLRFEVVAQDLGIESWVTTVEGAYAIRACDDGAEIALTTRYLGRMRPRWLWRAPERWVAGALHRHILRAMDASLRERGAASSA
jgi:hypothetical protein